MIEKVGNVGVVGVSVNKDAMDPYIIVGERSYTPEDALKLRFLVDHPHSQGPQCVQTRINASGVCYVAV